MHSIFETPAGSLDGWVVPDSTDAEPNPQVRSQASIVPFRIDVG